MTGGDANGTVVEIRDLDLTFQTADAPVHALSGIELTIKAGDFISLIGPSGCANPKDAALIVLDNDNTGAQTEKHQVRMMGEINKLTAGSNGRLDVADYERTVQTLLSGGSDPVITKAPTGAWTHAITDKAGLM